MSEQASSRSGRLIRVTFPDGEPAQHVYVVAIDDDRLALDFIRAALGVEDVSTEVVGDVSAGTLSALNMKASQAPVTAIDMVSGRRTADRTARRKPVSINRVSVH